MRQPRLYLHPRTQQPIVPVGFRKDGRAIWPILGASEPPNQPPADPPADPPEDPPEDLGFPANTRVEDMTAEQRAEYWRNQSKVQQARVPKNLTELQQKARDYDELVASTRSEAEIAIDEALELGRDEGRAEVRQEAAAEILRATLTDRGKKPDEVDRIMRGLNPAGFLSEDGSTIDIAAIRGFANELIPGSSTGPVDLGQGRRGGQGKPSVASGRDLYEQRHAKKTPADSTT